MGRNKLVPDLANADIVATNSNLQQNGSRLRQALALFGLFFETAHESDPLPALQDLACDLLQADNLQIAVPAGIRPAYANDPHYLVQPVAIGGRPVGHLTARREIPFDNEDRALAFFVGQITGFVLEQSSLYSQIEQYRQQAEANADTLDQLLVFNRRIISGMSDPAQLALLLATLVPEMVASDRASLLLVPPENPTAPQLVLSNGTFATTERARAVCDSGLAGLVLRERRPLIIDETETDRRWLALDTYEDPSRCAMAVPLLWGDQILGVLTVTTTRSRLFNTSHLNLLELVAHNVALALRSVTFNDRRDQLTALFAATASDLTATLQVAQASLQQLLPIDMQNTCVSIEVATLRKLAAALQRIGAIEQQLATAHHELLAMLKPVLHDTGAPDIMT